MTIAEEMHKLKMKKRYGKKKRKAYDFKKTAHQRAKMKKGKTKVQVKKEIKQRIKEKKPYIQTNLNNFIGEQK